MKGKVLPGQGGPGTTDSEEAAWPREPGTAYVEGAAWPREPETADVEGAAWSGKPGTACATMAEAVTPLKDEMRPQQEDWKNDSRLLLLL
jgi:hypothetical protein